MDQLKGFTSDRFRAMTRCSGVGSRLLLPRCICHQRIYDTTPTKATSRGVEGNQADLRKEAL